jgi:hypothetical protein
MASAAFKLLSHRLTFLYRMPVGRGTEKNEKQGNGHYPEPIETGSASMTHVRKSMNKILPNRQHTSFIEPMSLKI